MKRSLFSLSHYRLLSCQMGNLVPIGMFPVLPGDSVQQSTALLLRTSPLVSPVMHPVRIRIHHWFVPNRLLWANNSDSGGWEAFITQGPSGTTNSTIPQINLGGGQFAVSSLADYLGCTPTVTGMVMNALPFRAYQLIWNSFYRDEDLSAIAGFSDQDGPDTTTSGVLNPVCWEKDYLTTARPWTQKGASITIPLGNSAPVQVNSASASTPPATGPIIRDMTTGAAVTGVPELLAPGSGAGLGTAGMSYAATSAGPGDPAYFDPNNSLIANLSAATGITVDALRTSLALQRFEEARARFGSRFTEYLRYLGVRSADARLQLPEYLGGGQQTIQFSEVLQTTPGSTVDDTLGAMGGHGIGLTRSNRYRRYFTEHGYVLTLMSVIPKSIYTQGMNREWWKSVYTDYWQRELEHIGQQGVFNGEVYPVGSGVSGQDTETFGYQDRYDEYRRIESSIHGQFRTTLDTWHFGRKFAALPGINSTFVTANPTNIPFVDQTGDDLLWCQVKHSIQARRLLTQRAVPKTF